VIKKQYIKNTGKHFQYNESAHLQTSTEKILLTTYKHSEHESGYNAGHRRQKNNYQQTEVLQRPQQ